MKKKLLMVLKMAAFLSFKGLLLEIVLFNILLASVPSVAQNLKDIKVSIFLNNVTVEQALQTIEEKTNFKFNYIKDDLPRDETVCINTASGSLHDILTGIAKEYSLEFKRVNEQITVIKANGEAENIITTVEIGVVKGYVTDADTKEPLQGVTVQIKGTTIGTFTDKRGYYELNGIKPGKYTLVASYVGYSAVAKDVTILADKTTEVNFQLGQSAMNLDEVVVTGSISERSVKESANPITIITPKDLENRNLSSLGSVLQSVPGIVSTFTAVQVKPGSVGKASDLGLQQLNIRGYSPSGDLSNNTKFLIDGVEVYDYRTLNYIDLNEVEKIEVSRGPMSSTLYGAGSSGGVIQIFTKKGSGAVKFSFKTMFTSQESKYQDANPINQQYSMSLSGGKPDFGYRTSLKYSLYPISRWAVNNGIDEKDIDFNSNIYGNIGNIKTELNIRYGTSRSGNAANNIWQKLALAENWTYASKIKVTLSDLEKEIKSYTLGLTLRQALTDNIYHSLTVGNSQNLTYTHTYTAFVSSAGNLYAESDYNYTLQSLKYFINLSQPIGADFKADITAGIDLNKGQYNQLYTYFNTQYGDNVTQSLTTSSSGSNVVKTSTTTGFFGESVFGLWDKIFLTTGIRAEKNSSYGDDLGWYTMPRVGLTYVTALGQFTVKPRISWGQSTQPVSPSYKIGTTTVSGSYTYQYLANENLKPQGQQGYEAGLDIFFGNNYSMGFTYYYQKVTNLVSSIYLSELSSTYLYVYQYQNISEVFNKGFEVNAKAILNPFTIDIAASVTDSRYGSGFTYSSYYPYLVEGGRVINVPTGNLFARLSYRVPAFFSWSDKGGNISVEYAWTGSEINYDYYYYMEAVYNKGKYATQYRSCDAFYLINLRGDYNILNSVNIYIDISNLLNDQKFNGGYYPQNGRRITFGVNYSTL